MTEKKHHGRELTVEIRTKALPQASLSRLAAALGKGGSR